MPITIRCPDPACATTSSVADSTTGRLIQCRSCGKPFVAEATIDRRSSDTRKSQPTSNADPFPQLPAEFGRYRILRLLGRGGMGAVYLAQDVQLERLVALKVPFFDAARAPQRAERFVREARSAASLQHPGICTIFDAGQLRGRPFFTMMYLEGTTLDRLIDPDSPMPEPLATETARKIALALAHSHDKGIVHRDLKPANVMVVENGDPVVMDFGLAKQTGAGEPGALKLTADGGVLGTPSYMSPEQVRGDLAAIGPATDIYSLGAILFEMLTGTTPYGGGMTAIMGQILIAPVPAVRQFRPEVAPLLDTICTKAMAKNPQDRFDSMTALAEALGHPTRPTVSSVPVPLPVAAPSRELSPAEGPVRKSADRSQVAVSPFAEMSADPIPQQPSIRLKPKEPSGDSTAYRKKPESGRRSRMTAGLLACAVVGLGVLLAAVVLRVETKDGTIVVENLPADAEVLIDGETAIISRKGDRATVKTNAAGPHKLKVVQGGREVFSSDLTVVIGGEPVRVRIEPPTVAKSAPTPPPKSSAARAAVPSRAATGPKGDPTASSVSVSEGLSWLAGKQVSDGGWNFDGTSPDRIAATGMALLPFLAAGETHKAGKKYVKTVAAGVEYLQGKLSKATGTFSGSSGTYAHAIATIAICEAYGMTQDPALKETARAAVKYVVDAQAPNGSWGYTPKTDGDTSILGWQVQALKSAKLAGLVVPEAAFKNADGFLASVSTDSGAVYGYSSRVATGNLNAVGLLSRCHAGWGPKHPAFVRGAGLLVKTPPAANGNDLPNVYSLYYATQVVHLCGGSDWSDVWLPAVQKMLATSQIKTDANKKGSWDPDKSMIGANCGRLGTTCLCLLTLEVPYRHLPLFKRGSDPNETAQSGPLTTSDIVSLPARMAKLPEPVVVGAPWLLEGDELVSNARAKKEGSVLFGDPTWSDYDFTFGFQLVSLKGHANARFHAPTVRTARVLEFGGGRNSAKDLYNMFEGKWGARTGGGFVRPGLELGRWYRVCIRVRREAVKVQLDGEQIIEGSNDDFTSGRLGFFFSEGAEARIRDLEVTAPDGLLLWKGVSKLGEKE